MVSPSNDFSNLAPGLISFRTGGLDNWVAWPRDDAVEADEQLWQLHLRLAHWVFGFVGPVAGIMVVGLIFDSGNAAG